ncbi:hypothetical protein [Kocuria rhizophila]|uniref:hypothetical protein n=1 Tax=Kocuria rhizophila TaxID=72000 RepID=UPI001EF46109|nr:hypothetical protein [Kocuria rhizophila]MCG7425883.1 hypothetical protein [Kocuria rhizophila]MCT1456882.1 hypothetical protein [Kocuria rhizophila]MCT2249810.1 hypothetical protein [Kocuria rhizophila]
MALPFVVANQFDRSPRSARLLAQNGAALVISLLISDLPHEELAASGILSHLLAILRRITTPIGRLSAARSAHGIPRHVLTGRSTSRAQRF